MIYSFEKTDPAKTRFVGVLRDNGVEFELIDKDRAVVRILGSPEPSVRRSLIQVYEGRRKLRMEQSNGDLYSSLKRSEELTIIAGPCSVESEEQIHAVAGFLREHGVGFIRGGAFKPRTSPESFQGMGESGLRIISEAARENGLRVVSEVMDRSQIDTLCKYADIIQIGSRNMFNYTLLTALGSVDKPVLLKRGMAATIDEWLKASEYVSLGGNEKIILCERGIRTFEPSTRNTLDLAAIPMAKMKCSYPVIADPSHAAGRNDIVIPLALASAAAGADGIMVEVHPDPNAALSDRNQALTLDQFKVLLQKLRNSPTGS